MSAYERDTEGVVGLSAVEVGTGKELLDFRKNQLRIPASNQKLLTGAAALVRLGADFSFTTKVHLVGEDIVVVGDYDPILGDPVLGGAQGRTIYGEIDRWAAEIKKKLGDKPPGDILVCVRADRRDYRHGDWPKQQSQRWYAAPVAALNFNNNCVGVTFRLDQQRIAPAISPTTRFIKIVNKVQVTRRHRWRLQSNSDDSILTFAGTVTGAAADPIRVAIDDPPLLLGRVLADRLERSGSSPTGQVRRVKQDTVDLGGGKLVCQTTTSLGTALKRANKRSLNMAAECILLRSGDGTWVGSARIVSQTLTDAYGLDPKSFVVRDGGGLSRKNLVAPATLTKLLLEVLKRKDAKMFLESLPISGVDGTMRRRLAEPKYRHRVLGKTGHLAGVSSLSGYVLDEAGVPAIAFSILVNRAKGNPRGLQDQICRLLVNSISDK